MNTHTANNFQFISTKSLYSKIKWVSDQVSEGKSFIVLKHSRPAYKISPLDENEKVETKKYSTNDLDQFIFSSENKETNLAQNFKKHLYSA